MTCCGLERRVHRCGGVWDALLIAATLDKRLNELEWEVDGVVALGKENGCGLIA